MFELTTLMDLVKDATPIQDPSTLDSDKPLRSQGLDSLDHSSLLLAVEESQKIKIPDADVERLATLNDILRYVNTRLGEG